jgi:hypothetical protein
MTLVLHELRIGESGRAYASIWKSILVADGYPLTHQEIFNDLASGALRLMWRPWVIIDRWSRPRALFQYCPLVSNVFEYL